MTEVQREVVTEEREDIRVLPQDRLDLRARLQQERGILAGDEVELAEKAWTKRAPESLEEIHAAVDAMELPGGDEARGPPEERVDAMPSDELAAYPTRDLPEGVEPLTDRERRAIEAHVEGELIKASPIYRSGRGQVVEVLTRRDSRIHRTLLTVLGSDVRDLDAVARAVDRLRARQEAQAGEADATDDAEAPDAPTSDPGEAEGDDDEAADDAHDAA